MLDSSLKIIYYFQDFYLINFDKKKNYLYYFYLKYLNYFEYICIILNFICYYNIKSVLLFTNIIVFA